MKSLKSKLTLEEVLQQTFFERQARNPNYSLRSFARHLTIGAPALSEILQGKRRVSKTMAEKLIGRIPLEPTKRELLLKLLEPLSASKSRKKGSKPGRLQIDFDQYQSVADWHHYAILSLAETKHFKSDPAWIAKRLGISKQKVEESLQRLERLKSIKRTAKGKIKLAHAGVTSSDNIVNLSVRKSHYQNLDLARHSLDFDDIQKRDFTAITMAVDATRLEEAKKMIRVFRDKLCRFLEGGNKAEVYRMCVQLFPLTKESHGDVVDEESVCR